MDLDRNQPELLQFRDAGKAATDCFLRWLLCQQRIIASQQGTPVTKFNTIAEIFIAAQEVQTRSIAVPVSVMNSLRDAIKYRRRVADTLDKTSDADEGHENFIWRYVT